MSLKYEEGSLVVQIDSDKDGKPSYEAIVPLKEVFEEGMAAVNKGEEKTISVDAKKVDFKFSAEGIEILVDTDQDGEPVLINKIYPGEAFDEISQKFFSK